VTISSALNIYNLALSAVNARGRLSSLTDNKRERHECDTWYDLTVKTVQEAAHWPCCKTTSVLEGQVERDWNSSWTEGDPDAEYKYSYELPPDCLRPRHLINYQSFSLSFDLKSGLVKLNTNVDDAVLVYSILQEDITLWSPNQIQATAHGLASFIAGPITGRGELVQKNVTLANQFLVDAQAYTDNSQEEQVEYIPPEFLARGYSGPTTRTRYIYPFGSLFGAAIK